MRSYRDRMSKPICPVCMGNAVPARGSVDSDVLIIGEFPGTEEMRSLRPFSGGAGGVLRQEFANCGIYLGDFRVTNLWVHPIHVTYTEHIHQFGNEVSNKELIDDLNKKCLEYSTKLVMDEAKGKKAILLVGSDVVSTFTDYTVSNVNGLEVGSTFKKTKIVVAMYNPAIVFHKTVGEIRFAVRNFSRLVKEAGLIHEENWE